MVFNGFLVFLMVLNDFFVVLIVGFKGVGMVLNQTDCFVG